LTYTLSGGDAALRGVLLLVGKGKAPPAMDAQVGLLLNDAV